MQLPDPNSTRRPGQAPYLRIATEEAFAPPEMMDEYRKILARGNVDPGFQGLMGFYMSSPSERAQHIMRCLTDLDQLRLAHMDACGIDRQVIALTAPGVQVMDRATAVTMAQLANDQLSEAIRRHPTRFAGMIAVPPQDPAACAKEIERGVTRLGMHAVVINSHTQGEYLSDPKFWDIFAAAEAFDTPIYLHPNALPANMIGSFQDCGLDGAIYGFGVETGLHALRIITSGVFDRFPKLRMVIGHMGEALPFWAYRLDYMHQATVRSRRYDSIRPLQKLPSDYLREHFYITNSGVAWEPAIRFTQQFMGPERVLYAMDYPYQHAVDEVIALDAMDMSPAGPLPRGSHRSAQHEGTLMGAQHKKMFFQSNAETVFKLDRA